MSQATEKAVAAAVPTTTHKHIAPPYVGAGLSRYQYGPADPGFWTAYRHDVSKGGLVIQIGIDANKPPANSGFAYAGYQYEFTPEISGYYSFAAKFNPGTITLKQDANNVLLPNCFMAFEIPNSPATSAPLSSNTPVCLTMERHFAKGEKTPLLFLCGMDFTRYNFNPTQAYGEIIIKDTNLELVVSAIGTLQSPVAAGAETAPVRLKGKGFVLESVGSIEEAKAKGLTGIF